jgi:uncharacterized protein (DUF302 family)
MSYGNAITLDLGYDEALARARETFKRHGFGTLTEIDVAATLKEKLGQDIEPYAILGVCNPELAHRALDVDRSMGLLLPCTVVVRATEHGTTVEALDPQVMVTVPGHPEMQPIADDAAQRINAALEELTA